MDISILVDANFAKVIRNASETARQVRAQMQSIDQQARQLAARGASPAAISQAVGAARQQVATGVNEAGLAAGLSQQKRDQRAETVRLADDRILAKLRGYLDSLEQTERAGRAQARTAQTAATEAAASERRTRSARERKVSAEQRAAAAAERAAQQAERTSTGPRGAAAVGAAAGAPSDRARQSRLERAREVQRLADDEGISFDEARAAVRRSEEAITGYHRDVSERARLLLNQLAAQLERNFGIVSKEISGRPRDQRYRVYWDDEDTRRSLGLGQADPDAPYGRRLQLPAHLRNFFQLIDRPSTLGQLGVDPADVPRARPGDDLHQLLTQLGGRGLQAEDDSSDGALRALRELTDVITQLRAVVRDRDTAAREGARLGLAEQDPLTQYALGARNQGPYALGRAARDYLRDYELSDIQRLEQDRGLGGVRAAGTRQAAELERLANAERLLVRQQEGYKTPRENQQRIDAERRAEAEEIRAQQRAAAELNALQGEIEDTINRLARFGIGVEDVLDRFGGGGRGGVPPGGGPGGPDDEDPMDRLRRLLAELTARLGTATAAGQAPSEDIIRQYGRAAEDPAGYLDELRRRERYFASQRELQRGGGANIFDLRAFEEGISRRAGLLFGNAYEQEFRRRDQAALTGPDDRQLFAGAARGRDIIEQLGIDPESDLGLRTMKDILVREREAREEIVDQLARQANVEEREQRAYAAALRRLTSATQDTANVRAAAAARTETGRSLRDVEAEARAENERARAQASIDDVAARRRLGVNDVINEQQLVARLEQQQNRLALAQRLESNRDYIQAQAATVASERRLQAAINQQAQQMLLAEPGIGGSGTRFQRLQATLSQRTGGSPRTPGDYQQFGQFLQSRFLTTAGFALSGAATYFAQAQIREIIREATELQTEFRIIEGVLQSVGITGRRAWNEVRQGVLEVSKETATSADVVARVQRQLAGAFSDPQTLQPNFDRARTESRSAFQLARVAGLPEQEITDSLTAVALAFEQSGIPITFEQVGDLIVGLENRFGVLSTEIVRFTADLAPLAAELGFTAQEISTIGAAAQQASGQAGGALAEQFRRIIPGLQQRATEVVALFQQVGSAGELGEAFGANDLSQVLRILLRDYDQLNAAQQNQLATLVGGRREAGAFFALLNRGDAVLQSLEGGTGQFAGSLEERFGAVSESVRFSMDRLERAVEELGIAIFEAGLADALSGIADAGTFLVTIFGGVLQVFGELNDLLGGMPAKVIGLVLAFEALRRAGGFAGGLVGTLRGGSPAAAAGPGGGLNQLALLSGVGLGPVGGRSAAAQQTAAAAQQRNFLRRLLGSQAVRAGGITAGGFLLGGLANSAGQQQLGSTLSGAATGVGIGSFFGPWGAGIGGIAGAGYGFLQGRNDQQALRAVNAQRARDAQQYASALRHLARTQDNEDAERLLEAIYSREGLSEEQLEELNQIISDQSTLGNTRFQNAAESDAEQQVRLLERDAQRRQLSFQEAITSYESGRGDQQDVLAAFAAELSAINDQIAGAEAAGNDPTDLLLQRLQVERERAQFLAQAINARFDLADQTAELFGGQGAGSQADLSRAQQRLAALQAAGADPAAITEAAFAVLQVQRDMLDAQIAATEDAGEQIAIANRGIQADANAAAVIAEAQLRELFASGIRDNINMIVGSMADAFRESLQALNINGAVSVANLRSGRAGGLGTGGSNNIDQYGLGAGARSEAQRAAREAAQVVEEFGLSDQDVDEIIDLVVATGEAETETVRRIFEALFRRMINLARLISAAKLQGPELLAAFQQLLEVQRSIGQFANLINQIEDSVPDNNIIQGDPETGQGGGSGPDPNDLARRIAEARLAVQRAQADGDPVRLAQLAIQAAQIQIQFAKDEAERLQGFAALIEAQNQLRDAQRDIETAYIELVQARINDPVANAAFALALATRAVSLAKGEAARLRALAEQVAAERAYRDAVAEVLDSRVELAIAIAQAAGDDVKSAELALQLAQQRLQRAIAEGDGEAAINRARQEVISTQAALRDAQLASQRADIEFALDMGRATVSQAISQLQALLQIPGLTEQQTRDILLRIRQLREQLNQDLSFNLPTDLRLPTLYETRRLVQAQEQGTNYQGAQVQSNDNRIITITLNGGSEEALTQAVETIVQAIDAPPRTGTYVGILEGTQ